ncbi:MAG TPA: N-acetyltransferase [Pirellulaceae bacterium]|nr:N-acetyltransferase [Pirellulaceae bacterium]
MYQAWTYGDYVLRECRSVDIPVIAALEWACQTHPWQLEYVEAFLTVPHEGHEQFGLMVSRERRPVGYAILAVGGGNMSVVRIGVFPDFRRHRVGTRLIAHAMLLARVRRLEFMSAVLRESNVAAQKFYFGCGFLAGRIAGPLKGWFGDEDAVAMRRPVVLPMPV